VSLIRHMARLCSGYFNRSAITEDVVRLPPTAQIRHELACTPDTNVPSASRIIIASQFDKNQLCPLPDVLRKARALRKS
jgi:hypothetical protein